MPTRPKTLKRPKPKAARPSPAARGYDSAWQRTRKAFLALHPFCQDCSRLGLHVGATEVDHIRPLSRGGKNTESNLQSLCKSCHSRKTAAKDGGLGQTRG